MSELDNLPPFLRNIVKEMGIHPDQVAKVHMVAVHPATGKTQTFEVPTENVVEEDSGLSQHTLDQIAGNPELHKMIDDASDLIDELEKDRDSFRAEYQLATRWIYALHRRIVQMDPSAGAVVLSADELSNTPSCVHVSTRPVGPDGQYVLLDVRGH